MELGPLFTLLLSGCVAIGAVWLVIRARRERKQIESERNERPQKHTAHSPDVGIDRAEQIRKGGLGSKSGSSV